VEDNTDCSDTDKNVHPAAPELCNGFDDDCNGVIDDGLPTYDYYPDSDGDTFGSATMSPFVTCDVRPDGYTTDHSDCDDSLADVYPGAEEICNGMDDDCDGFVDQDDPEGVSGYFTFYWDSDGDGFGLDSPTIQDCDAPAGYVAENGDCDDDRATVYPGAVETCNGLDDNCDGQRDDSFPRVYFFVDKDDDGFGDEEVKACEELEDPAGAGLASARGDCNDSAPDVYPGALDGVSDGVDQDCGGSYGPDPHVGLSDDSYSSSEWLCRPQ
jgi:hypothetical protein